MINSGFDFCDFSYELRINRSFRITSGLTLLKLKYFYTIKIISQLFNTNKEDITLPDALHYCILNFVLLLKYKRSNFASRFSNKFENLVICKRVTHVFQLVLVTKTHFQHNVINIIMSQQSIRYKKMWKTC